MQAERMATPHKYRSGFFFLSRFRQFHGGNGPARIWKFTSTFYQIFILMHTKPCKTIDNHTIAHITNLFTL